MATIILERSNEFNNRFRNFGVYIDGKKAGTIANGKTQEFEVSSGNHTILCKIDWASSQEIKFNTDTDLVKLFKVRGYSSSKWSVPLTLGAFVFFLILKGFGFSTPYYTLFFIPFFLVGIYYTTIGRKNYLTLSEK
jgi:hypothetical protein